MIVNHINILYFFFRVFLEISKILTTVGVMFFFLPQLIYLSNIARIVVQQNLGCVGRQFWPPTPLDGYYLKIMLLI